MKILIVEDDMTSQMMLKSMLTDHTLTLVDSGEAGLEKIIADTPDIIILDINLPGIDGYETCRQLRLLPKTVSTPVIFLSSYTELKDRLEAYGSGGNDYVGKPFDRTEFVSKIKFFTEIIRKRQIAEQDQKSSEDLIMVMQTSAANLQSISRFIQATLYCDDLDSLYWHFFKAAKEIDLKCVLQVDCDFGKEIRSADGNISNLEYEIMGLSSAAERIHSFGQDRAIYSWGHATLLTRNVGNLIDTIAIFMDALEAGIKLIDTEHKLLQQVEDREKQNTQLEKRVEKSLEEMNYELKEAILSLGLLSVLEVDDEELLNEIMDRFNNEIRSELKILKGNNQIILDLIGDLRNPPPELESLMEIDGENDDGGISFL